MELENGTTLANYSTAQTRYARFEIRALARDDQALGRMKRALELDPSSLVTNDNLSQIYLATGNADAALEQAKRTTELDQMFAFGWVDLTYAQIKKVCIPMHLLLAQKPSKCQNEPAVLWSVLELLTRRQDGVAT